MSDILRGDTLSVCFDQAVESYSSLPFLSWIVKEGDETLKRSLSFSEVGAQVDRLANYLNSLQLPDEAGVMILSGNSPRWIISEFAIIKAGLTVVAPYPTLSAEEVQWQLKDANASVAIVENREQLQKLGDLDREDLIKVIGLTPLPPHPKVIQYDDLILASLVLPTAVYRQIGKDTKAVQLYTSGSSGKPKGVEKTHENLLKNVSYFLKLPLFDSGMTITGILPFAHIYPLLSTFLAAFGGMELVTPSGPSTRARLNPIAIRDCLKYGEADAAILVPQFLERVMYDIRRSSLSEVLGTKLRYILTGGSALPAPLAQFFKEQGIEVLQGYGGTEWGISHAELPTGSLEGYVKIPGSVGFPLDPEIKQRVHPDTGELMICSPTIMRGYAGLPEKTSDVIELIEGERWYHTGDSVRVLDEFGSLEITGRLDRMYNNIGGEKVYPEAIERRIEEHPLVGFVVVWGDGKPHNIAIISPHEGTAKAWADAHGVEFSQLNNSREFKEEIVVYITSTVNPTFKAVERVQGVLIAEKPFSLEPGLLTSSLKVRPKQVVAAYRDKIEAMY